MFKNHLYNHNKLDLEMQPNQHVILYIIFKTIKIQFFKIFSNIFFCVVSS